MKTKNKKIDFLPKILYDLKTPALAQITALETLLKISGKNFGSQDKDLIELTIHSCRYMQHLIEVFGMINSMESEKIKPFCEIFDINQVLKKILNELKIILKYKNLTVNIDTSKELLVYADKLYIKITIFNLLSNSIDYSFDNSSIDINFFTKKNHLFFENINFFTKKNHLFFEIKSQGTPIMSSISKEIFEKYKRKSTFNKTTLGLGLYLSKEIINAHFGTIIAQSQENNTNIFGFEIPIR